MNFVDWMTARGTLVQTTIYRYDRALRSRLSKLAGIDLSQITDYQDFITHKLAIEQLDEFKQRNASGNKLLSNSLKQYAEYLKSDIGDEVEEDIAEIIADPKIKPTDKLRWIKARLNQGAFRDDLIEHWKCCAVTGLSNPSLLVASHIKPWRASVEGRLDKWNGLLLSPNLDKAFDKGFITFEKDGSIRISPRLTEAPKLGINSSMKIALQAEHEKYMDYHRDFEFKI
jgi:putative restriction endonuclease